MGSDPMTIPHYLINRLIRTENSSTSAQAPSSTVPLVLVVVVLGRGHKMRPYMSGSRRIQSHSGWLVEIAV